MGKRKVRRKSSRFKVDALEPGQAGVLREAAYIISKAKAGNARAVTLGTEILFFSTTQGDAWVLDFNEELATCLCLRGVAQPYSIRESTESFWIDWETSYELQGKTFVIYSEDGQSFEFQDYPTSEILTSISKARALHPPE